MFLDVGVVSQYIVENQYGIHVSVVGSCTEAVASVGGRYWIEECGAYTVTAARSGSTADGGAYTVTAVQGYG